MSHCYCAKRSFVSRRYKNLVIGCREETQGESSKKQLSNQLTSSQSFISGIQMPGRATILLCLILAPMLVLMLGTYCITQYPVTANQAFTSFLEWASGEKFQASVRVVDHTIFLPSPTISTDLSTQLPTTVQTTTVQKTLDTVTFPRQTVAQIAYKEFEEIDEVKEEDSLVTTMNRMDVFSFSKETKPSTPMLTIIRARATAISVFPEVSDDGAVAAGKQSVILWSYHN